MIKFFKLIFLLVLCGLFFISASAQNKNKIDSLMNVLKTAKEDTNKANTLNRLSICFQNVSDFINAKKYAEYALKLSDKLDYYKAKSEANNSLGLINWNQGNYVEAEKYFLIGLKLAKERNDKHAVAVTSANIGLINWNQGNYAKALEYFFTSLKIDEEAGDKERIATDYLNIGNVYFEQANSSDALKNYFAALAIVKELHDKQFLAMLQSNIGSIYMSQGKSDDAMIRFSEALIGYTEVEDKQGMAMVYNNIGEVYNAQHNYLAALKNYSSSLKLAEEVGDKRIAAASSCCIGNVYSSLRNFPEARKYLNRGLSLAKDVGLRDYIKSAYISLSALDSAMGNYKQAFEDYKLYTIYKDSLLNETSNKQTAEMKTKYESERKDKEILVLTKDSEIQNLEIKKQKLLKFSLIGGLALLLVTFFFVYNNFRVTNKLKLQNIRNKIASDLHDDVGSTLNSISIYSEVAKQKFPAVVDELEHIGDASRKIIEVMSDIVWSINPKNDTFENIILRMGTLAYNLLKAKNIEHAFQADESLNETKLSLESRRNFYLIFKEALNNLVKYSKATRGSILLTHENGLIKLAVRDNGIGFDVAQTSKGNGLLNMKDRAMEMNAQLKIESEKGSGTNVELIFKA